MYIEYERPAAGRKKEELKKFLAKHGLDFEESADFTVIYRSRNGEIAATASMEGNILKCIAIAEDYRGVNLTATLLTEMRGEAFHRGIENLFIYTKPESVPMFREAGFFEIARAAGAALLESTRDGARNYAKSLAEPAPEGPGGTAGRIGSIVMNANPYTIGHDYLVRKALEHCSLLHIFVVSEDKSYFNFEERMRRVKLANASRSAVRVHETKQYMISSLTFPTYFIKDKASAEDTRCELDLEIFCNIFAKEMNIDIRFVGTEPLDPVTARYNELMKLRLPSCGVELIEIPRLEKDGEIVSATKVRERIKRGEEENFSFKI